jgi:acyl-CoA reductase-like NAD-dependent aldehyde dehydrogenase
MVGSNFINGQWRSSDKRSTTYNPSDLDELVGDYAQASAADVEEALHAARQALPVWAASNIQLRSDVLRQVGDALFAQAEDIGTLLAREEGKTRAEGMGEVVRSAQVFHYFAGEALRHPGQFLNSLRDGFTATVSYDPVGVISLITPWNFPLAIVAWKTAAALCFGNTVVLKPSNFVPGCALRLTQLFEQAKLPAGVFNLVMGGGREIGDIMVKGADGISFTGSTPTGQKILELAAKTMAKVQLELGGQNPMVVLDDADIDTAVDIALDGSFYQTGQRCTASSRLIVTRGSHDQFVEKLSAKVNALRVGHALDESTQIGPVANAPQLQQNLAAIATARAEGAECVAGGDMVECRTRGLYLAPTLFAGTTQQMTLNQNEVFGPVVGVIQVNDLDEAIAVALQGGHALSSGICTNDMRSAEHFRRKSNAGLVSINAPTAGIEYHVPFGGRKPSGYGGREMGSGAAEFFTESKTTYTNFGL